MNSESKSVNADDDKFFHRKRICQSCEDFRQSFCLKWYWGCSRDARDCYGKHLAKEKPACEKWEK